MPTARLVAALALTLATVLQATPLVAQSAAQGYSYRAPVILRLAVDSGEVRLHFYENGGAVEVVAPAGTFRVAPQQISELAEWAAVIEEQETAFRAGTVSPPPEVEITTFMIDRTAIWIAPVSGDSAVRFRLEGENGAWGFRLLLSPQQGAALLRALKRQRAAGVEVVGVPANADADEAPSHFSGAWLRTEVDRPAQVESRALQAPYPPALRGTGAKSAFQLSFIVDADGSVRPSSVQLIGSAQREFVLAARDALLRARFVPAERKGAKVASLVSHDFKF